MSASTSKKALASSTAGEPASRPRPASPWRLFLWILIPIVVAGGLAVAVMQWGGGGAGSAAGAANAAIPTLPSPTNPPAATPTTVAAAQAPATDTIAPATDTALPTPTLDPMTLALLTELPATLPVGSSTAPPPDQPDAAETAPPDATHPQLPPTPTIPPTAPPTDTPPTAEAQAPPADSTPDGPHDPITGLPVDASVANRVPIIAMIDNHPDAAPQTGLNSASLVIEALAEGGITRFESYFLGDDSAPVLGPIRSARPYFVEWAYPFKPVYVHCGGSWEAIDLINEAKGILTNSDCFDGNMPFWRSSDRLMPHNLYTSTDQLWKMAAARGLQAPATMPSFLHSDPLPADQRPDSASVSFVFSSLSRSDITWIYDHDTNRYLRQQWGYWHRDLATGDIVSARNVVILWTNVWQLPGDTSGRMGTDTVGQGTALIMRDGQFEWGYWNRKSAYSPLNISDGKKEPMRFAPGRIWIEVLGIGHKIQIGH